MIDDACFLILISFFMKFSISLLLDTRSQGIQRRQAGSGPPVKDNSIPYKDRQTPTLVCGKWLLIPLYLSPDLLGCIYDANVFIIVILVYYFVFYLQGMFAVSSGFVL